MATEKAIAKKQTKAEILSTITETSKLTKAQVKAVLEALASCAQNQTNPVRTTSDELCGD